MSPNSSSTNDGNTIYLVGGMGDELVESIPGLSISLRGKGATVRISKVTKFAGCRLFIGNEGKVDIGPSKHVINTMTAHVTSASTSLKIGKDFSAWGVAMKLEEPETSITIGEDCMFSYGITLRTTDGHSIYDLSSGEILNFGADIQIGNHCWVGQDAMILKGVTLADGVIVGARALVTKPCTEENVILTGAPAQIVRRGVGWKRESPWLSKHLKNTAAAKASG